MSLSRKLVNMAFTMSDLTSFKHSRMGHPYFGLPMIDA